MKPELNLNVNIKHEDGEKLFGILNDILTVLRQIMALNAEVAAYAARIDAATTKLANDIAAILANSTTALSAEDRATLENSVGALETLGTSSDPNLPKP